MSRPRFPSKRIMRAFRQWNGWPTPPKAIHVDELQEWIDRRKGLTRQERHDILKLQSGATKKSAPGL